MNKHTTILVSKSSKFVKGSGWQMPDQVKTELRVEIYATDMDEIVITGPNFASIAAQTSELVRDGKMPNDVRDAVYDVYNNIVKAS